ncbi:hypothetical protein QL285_062668 [Trifolium repens]|nr:hypothetical protein QL285_062668 [Trifolium repens]
MDRKNPKKIVAKGSKSQKGKKTLEASASLSRRTTVSRKVKAKHPSVSPRSSSSDDIDEDYAEFLKTYVPEEFYAYEPSPLKDEGSQITVEPAARTPKSSKVKTSK